MAATAATFAILAAGMPAAPAAAATAPADRAEAAELLLLHRTELAAGVSDAVVQLGEAWLADMDGLGELPMVGAGLGDLLADLRVPFDRTATDVRPGLEDALDEAARVGADPVEVVRGALWMAFGPTDAQAGGDRLAVLSPAVQDVLAPLRATFGDGLGLLVDGSDDGDDVDPDDIDVTVRPRLGADTPGDDSDDAEPEVEVGLGLAYVADSLRLPFDLGLDVPDTALVPDLGGVTSLPGSSADAAGTVSLDLLWETALTVVVSETDGFSIPVAAAPSLAVGIDGRLTGPTDADPFKLDAVLGTFAVTASDDTATPSQLDIDQTYTYAPATGALVRDRFIAGQAESAGDSGTVRLRLEVEPRATAGTPFGGRTLRLPEISFDLQADADLGQLKEVKLDDVTINAKQVLQGAGAAFGAFTETALAPIDAIASGLDTRLPGISDISPSDVTLSGLLPAEVDTVFDRVRQLGDAEQLIATGARNVPQRLNMGCYKVYDDEGQTFEPCALPYSNTYNLDGPGVTFDVLEPRNVVTLATGGTADLVSVSPGSLDASANGRIGVSAGRIGVGIDTSASAMAAIELVYDSTGLEKLAPALIAGEQVDLTTLLDGMYVKNSPTGPEAEVAASFSGSNSTSIGVGRLSVSLGASLNASSTLGLELVDPNRDGQLRRAEVAAITEGFSRPDNALCLFALESVHNGGVSVYGPGVSFSLPVSIDLPLERLFNLRSDCAAVIDAAARRAGTPVLASPVRLGGDDWLRLNVGAFGPMREFGLLDDDAGISASARSVAACPGGGAGVVVAFRGIEQCYEGTWAGVWALGGDGPDAIDLSGVDVPVLLGGGAGRDVLVGGRADDVLTGGEGDDRLLGGAGDDRLRGEGGADRLTGQTGDDDLEGGAGSDPQLDGGPGHDRIRGGDGGDALAGGTGDDDLAGGDGDDTMTGGAGADQLRGGLGDDTAAGGSGDDLVTGGPGRDTLDGDQGRDNVDGGAGDDRRVHGGDGDDLVTGGAGNDTLVHGGAGADHVLGGAGDDHVQGGDGDDTINGGLGDDTGDGGDGNDRITAGPGNDVLGGGPGDDELRGGLGADDLDGAAGRDLVIGEEGDDTLRGGAAAEDEVDRLVGGPGDDTVSEAGGGADRIDLGEGDDTVTDAGPGDDTITTGPGDDTVTDAGDGDDTITTGAGADTVVTAGDGNDLVDTADPTPAPAGADTRPGDDDTVHGGPGDDTVLTGRGDDELHGDDGGDTLDGGDGDDLLLGGAGDDLLDAGAGDDVADGGDDDDLVLGGPGDDGNGAATVSRAGRTGLLGGDGDDVVEGGPGDDLLRGGAGDDVLRGGTGDDDLGGGEQADALYGGAGSDLVSGGFGDSWLEGGRLDAPTGDRDEIVVVASSSTSPGGTVANGVLESPAGRSVYTGAEVLRVLVGEGNEVALDDPSLAVEVRLTGGTLDVRSASRAVDVEGLPLCRPGLTDPCRTSLQDNVLRVRGDDPSGVVATLEAGAVRGLVEVDVTHSGIDEVVLEGSAAGDDLRVVTVDQLTTFDGAAGDDTVRLTLPADIAQLQVDGGAGDDTVELTIADTTALAPLAAGFSGVETAVVDASASVAGARWALLAGGLTATPQPGDPVPLLASTVGVDAVHFLGTTAGDDVSVVADAAFPQVVTVGDDTVSVVEQPPVLSFADRVATNGAAGDAAGDTFLLAGPGPVGVSDVAVASGTVTERAGLDFASTLGDDDEPVGERLVAVGTTPVSLDGDVRRGLVPDATGDTLVRTPLPADLDGLDDLDLDRRGPSTEDPRQLVTLDDGLVEVFRDASGTGFTDLTAARTRVGALAFAGSTAPGGVPSVTDGGVTPAAVATAGDFVFVADPTNPGLGFVRTYSVDGRVTSTLPTSAATARSWGRAETFREFGDYNVSSDRYPIELEYTFDDALTFDVPRPEAAQGLPLTNVTVRMTEPAKPFAFATNNKGVFVQVPRFSITVRQRGAAGHIVQRSGTTPYSGTFDGTSKTFGLPLASTSSSLRRDDLEVAVELDRRLRFTDDYTPAQTIPHPFGGPPIEVAPRTYDQAPEVTADLTTYRNRLGPLDITFEYGNGAINQRFSPGGSVVLTSGSDPTGLDLATVGDVLVVAEPAAGTLRTSRDLGGYYSPGTVTSPGDVTAGMVVDTTDAQLAVGQPGAAGGRGRVLVYDVTTTGALSLRHTYLGEVAGDRFGAAVSLDATRGLLVGAPGADDTAPGDQAGAGAAYLVPSVGGTLGDPVRLELQDAVVAQRTAEDVPRAGDGCGSSVLLTDATVFGELHVGCPGRGDSGEGDVLRLVPTFAGAEVVAAVDADRFVVARPGYGLLSLVARDGGDQADVALDVGTPGDGLVLDGSATTVVVGDGDRVQTARVSDTGLVDVRTHTLSAGTVAAVAAGDGLASVMTTDGDLLVVRTDGTVLFDGPTGLADVRVLEPADDRLLVGTGDAVAVIDLTDPTTPTTTATVRNGPGGVRGLADVAGLDLAGEFLLVATDTPGPQDRLLVLEELRGRYVLRQTLTQLAGGVRGLSDPNHVHVVGTDVFVGSSGDDRGVARFSLPSEPLEPTSAEVRVDDQVTALDVRTGDGADTWTVRDTGRPLAVTTGGGDDSVTAALVDPADVPGLTERLHVATGPGGDVVDVRDLTGAAVVVRAGPDDDLVTVGGTGSSGPSAPGATCAEPARNCVDLGPGADVVEVAGDDLAVGVAVDGTHDAPDTLRVRTSGSLDPAAPPLPDGLVRASGAGAGTDYRGIEVVERVVGLDASAADPGTTTEGDDLVGRLDASGSSVPGGDVTYAWDLNGDGAFGDATGVAPDPTWAELVALGVDDDGTWPVSVQVTVTRTDPTLGPVTESAIDTVALRIANRAPVLGPAAPGTVTVDQGAPFTLPVDLVDPGDDEVVSFVVDWGDGTIQTILSLPPGGTITHTYDEPTGLVPHRVRVTAVTDEDGIHPQTSGVVDVTVTAVVPTAVTARRAPGTFLDDAGVVAEGTPYVLEVAEVGVPAGTAPDLRINWGDGTVETFTAADRQASYEHVFDGPATAEVGVALLDAGRAVIGDGPTVQVTGVDPTLTLAGPGRTDEGVYSLALSATDPGDDTVTRYEVDWGDGTSSTALADPSGAATAEHVLDGPATRVVTVTAVDEDGASSDAKLVTVDNLAPAIVDTVVPSAAVEGAGAAVRVTATDVDPLVYALRDPTGTLLDRNDSGRFTLVPADDGRVEVVAEVTDDDGATTATNLAFEVANAVPQVEVAIDDVPEGTTALLSLGVADPGDDTATSATVRIDGAVRSLAIVDGAGTLPVPAPDGDAVRQVEVVDVTDEDGLHPVGAVATMTVTDVDPSLRVFAADTAAAGQPFTLSTDAIVDPGDDTVTAVTVDWGDGTSDALLLGPDGAGPATHVWDASAARRDVTVAVTDEDGTRTFDRTVTVRRPPVLDTDLLLRTDEDTPVSLDITEVATDPDGDLAPDGTLVVARSAPAGDVADDRLGLPTLTGPGIVTFEPRLDRSGTDTFTVAACDTTGLCTEGTVTVEVAPVPDPPRTFTDAVTITDTGSATVDVLANDIDPDDPTAEGTLSLTSVDALASGLVVAIVDGQVTVDTAGAFEGLFNDEALTVEVGYTATDVDGTTPGTLVVTIQGEGFRPGILPPTLVDGGTTLRLEVDEDTPVSFEPLDVLVDPDGGTPRLVGFDVTSEQGGTITTGSLVYTPAPDFNGQDTFQFVAATEAGVEATFDVLVTVLPTPDAPRLLVDGEQVDRVTLTFPHGGTPDPLAFVDPDGDDVTVRVVEGVLPDGLALQPDGTFTGTASPTEVLSIIVEACDPGGACTRVDVTLDGRPRGGVVDALPVTGAAALLLLGTALALLALGTALLRRRRRTLLVVSSDPATHGRRG